MFFFGAPFDASQRLRAPKGACAMQLSQVPIEYRPLMCESIDPNTREISTISKGRTKDFPSRMVMDGDGWWIMVKGHLEVPIPWILGLFL